MNRYYMYIDDHGNLMRFEDALPLPYDRIGILWQDHLKVTAEKEREIVRLKTAIRNCIDYANNGEMEWGESFKFLYQVMEDENEEERTI